MQLKAGGQVDNRLKAAVETLMQHRKGSEWQRKTLLLRIGLDRSGEVGAVIAPAQSCCLSLSAILNSPIKG